MTEIVGPDASGYYVTYTDGVPGAPWKPDFSQLAAPASAGTTTFDRDGNAIIPPLATAAPLAPPPSSAAGAPATPTAADPTAWAAGPAPRSGPFAAGYTPSAPQGSGGGGYVVPPANFGEMHDDPFANIPPYQNGQVHPAAGGAPLVPGGAAAAAAQGLDNRQQVYVPGGAAAGPFETRSAPTPSGANTGGYGGGASWNDQGRQGGGGGSDMGANSALGRAMAGKVRGMAAKMQGGGTASGSSYGSDTSAYRRQQRQYRRQGRRIDDAYDAYNDELADPKPLPVRGWAKDVGIKPGTINAGLVDPMMIRDNLFNDQLLDGAYYDSLNSTPMTDLALILGGTQNRRGMSTNTPVVKVPKILREQGVKPVKPEQKRIIDPSKVTNKIAALFGGVEKATPGGGAWFDSDQLLDNLATAKPKSILRQNLKHQFADDPGGTLESAKNYVRSALSVLPGNAANQARLASVDRVAQMMGGDALTLNRKHFDRFVGDLAGYYQD
jgi:hypothetical protein